MPSNERTQLSSANHVIGGPGVNQPLHWPIHWSRQGWVQFAGRRRRRARPYKDGHRCPRLPLLGGTTAAFGIFGSLRLRLAFRLFGRRSLMVSGGHRHGRCRLAVAPLTGSFFGCMTEVAVRALRALSFCPEPAGNRGRVNAARTGSAPWRSVPISIPPGRASTAAGGRLGTWRPVTLA